MPYNPFARSQPSAPTTPGPQPSTGYNPFARSQPAQEPTADTQPVAPALTPQTWDYKTAQFGLHGEDLPDGAEGWTPYGQPFFGGGVMGKLKEYAWNFKKDIQAADPEEWDAIKAQWKSLNERQRAAGPALPGQENEEQRKLNVEGTQLIGKAIGTWWKDLESNKQTPVGVASRALGTGLQAIGDVFSQPAKGVENVISAGIEGVKALQGPAPRMDDNEFTKGTAENDTGTVGDVTSRAFESGNGGFERVLDKIKSGWNAGRILYASAFDKSLREEYIRRYEAGEDPDLLGMELSNRNVNVWGHEVNANLIEAGGQMAFDPLNAVGALTKGMKLASQINKASDIGGITRDAAALDALKVIETTQDEAQAVESWKTVVQAQQKAVQAVESGELLKQRWTRRALDVASRQKGLVALTSDWLGLQAGSLIREGYQKEDLLEALKFGIKSISKNADDVQEGVAGLAKLPNASRWLGDDAIHTYKTLENLLTDDNGVMNFSRLDKMFSKQNDFAGFAEEASKMLETAAGYQFNTIDQMAEASREVAEASRKGATVSKKTEELAKMYETVPPHAKLLNAINDSKASQVRKAVNNTLGKYYFNYQGGVAAKNILSNNILIGIDDGLKAFAGFEDVVQGGKVLTRPKIWTDGAIADNLSSWFGDFKPSGVAGFETAGKAATGEKATIFGKLMEKGEQTGARRIFDSAVRESMKKLLKLEKLGDVKSLKAAGVSEQDLKTFEKLFYLEKGNTQKVMETFRALKAGKSGQQTTEAWRTLDFLTNREVEALDSMGLMDELHDLTKTAQTPEDIEAAFARWKKAISEHAGGAVNDTPGVSDSNPALTAFGYLSDAENSGLLDKGASAIFATITEAADTAHKEYTSMLRTTIDAVLMNDEIPAAQRAKLAQTREDVFKLLDKSGKETKRVSDSLVKNAWHYTDNFSQELKSAGGDYEKLWKKMGLEGEPPGDLDKRTLLSELWKTTKERQGIIWNGHFDNAFSESEKLKDSLSAYLDTTQLESQFSQARWAVQKAQEYRQVVYENGALKIKPMDNVLWMAKEYGIPSATEKGVPLDKGLLGIVNNNLAEGAEKFSKIEDVPPSQALQAFEKWRVENGRPPVKLSGFSVPPAHADGAMPSFARAWQENSRGLNYLLDRMKNNINQQWGRRVDSPFTPEMEKALQDFARNASPRVDEAKNIALKVGNEARNFTLLNYGQRTYGDVAASWIMPYHFWYTRQYKNWLSRLATSPEVVAGYAKYKQAMERIHYDMPDFFKQNVDVGKALDLVGIHTNHPLFLNLEAAVNPLYGLTGVDFNDKERRKDWFDGTLDDIGKFGPSVWAPLQIANALRHSVQGETDAAARWAGRLIPETKQIKELGAAWFGKNIELDPAVRLFSGGLDPYERNRVGRALAAMIGHPDANGNTITEEMTLEAGRSQKGALWDQAVVNASQLRAGQYGENALASYLLGVGFKGRTQEDVQIDEMQSQMARLQALNRGGGLTPEQYRQGWEKLAQEYPFMETVLLSRRGGEERDTAYAYNVLGRIPPGDSTKLFKQIGLSQDLVNKFYQDKGDMSKWTETDKNRFMSTMLDIGATYALPNDATRHEWNTVKTDYQDIQEEISKELGIPYTREGNKITGRGIWDMVSTYYDMKDTNKDKADAFKAQHPEIDEALGMLGEAKISDPLLAKYYTSLDTIESYYSGKNRSILADRFGKDITEKQQTYFDLGYQGKPAQKAYLKAHPELLRYWKEKHALDAGMNQAVLKIAAGLPQTAPGAQLREESTPQNATQELLAEYAGQQVQTWQEVSAPMSIPLQQRVQAYWYDGAPLPNAAVKELEYLARSNGYYNADDYLRSAGYALLMGQEQQPQAQPAQPSGYNPFASP